MRRHILVLAIALLVVTGTALRADDVRFVLFQDYLESLRAQAGIPGMAAAIIGQDGVLWSRGYGQADLARPTATSADTPFHVDGLTQLFTTTMILQCVEQGSVSLDDPIGQYATDAPEPTATIRQLLTHTSGDPAHPVFKYNPQRIDPLKSVIAACSGRSYRVAVEQLLGRLAMFNSVPGADVVQLVPPTDGAPDQTDMPRYTSALGNLATPYAVDGSGHATPSTYSTPTLTPSAGLITTVNDFAQFDVALKHGILLDPLTLAAAWQPPVDDHGNALPHGVGWFVQGYNGELVVWQMGVDVNAASSLVVMLPAHSLTMILTANSDQLVKPFALSAGDVTVSPFGRLFLGLFTK